MKKLFLLFVVFVATTSLWAEDFSVDGIYYNYLEDNNVEVTYRGNDYNSYDNEYSGAVAIPETVTYNGTTYSLTSIGFAAFAFCSSLTSITIPNSVTSIGDYAFDGCSSLTSVTIPNSVTSIGYAAFYDCSSLTSITIPNSVTSIGDWAFSACTDLTSITIGNSVTSIGDLAFYDCSSLTSITIPNSVTTVGGGMFYGCSKLKSVVLSNNITSLPSYYDYGTYGFFGKCSSLTSVTIPNSVTSIGKEAFAGCSSLTSVTIPNSVTSIGNDAFYNCSSLTSIVVESGNTIYDSRDNCNAIIETATNTLIAGCQNTIIPNSVKRIGDQAFYYCSSLTSVTIPNSVTSIGYAAFYNCSSLTSVTIGNSVTSIGDRAFQNCSALTSVTIPNSVTSIGDYAFANCYNLTSVTIPNSVTSIGDGAFSRCSSFTSIVVESGNTIYDSRDNCNAIIEIATNTLIAGCQNTVIPNSVTSIGESAFAGCSSLDTIYVKAMTPPSLGDRALTNAPASICYIPCGTLSTYETSDWAQYMGEFVEEECDKCGNYLYWQYDDTQLSITGYGDMYDYDIESHPWMQYRSKMQTISLPDGLTSVGAAAFADCKYVKSVTIPATVEKIHDSAFEDCRMLSSLNFAEPSALTFIGNWAFYNCHQLQNLTIPEGVTEIGDAAFYGCTYLEDMVLPSTIQAIGDNGFALCAKLQKIHVKAATPPTIQAKTFFDVNRQIPVYVPATAVEAYKDDPYWQEFNIQCNSSTPTAVEDVAAYGNGIQKLLRDGQLLILKDNKVYTLMGQEIQ